MKLIILFVNVKFDMEKTEKELSQVIFFTWFFVLAKSDFKVNFVFFCKDF